MPSAVSATFTLPKDGSHIVGKLQRHQVTKGETFALLAKDYDVGLLSLIAANRGVDPFLPTDGEVLTVPTRFILPTAKQKGIVINLAELRLYYFDPDGEHVHVFPVGIGRIGRETPQMVTSISSMIEAPTWTPPKSIRMAYEENGIELPEKVPAGPDNPLGEYAMRLRYGSGQYLIHGTNKDFGIGLRVSSGCIRMEPVDIEWLFNQVDRGTRVQIVNQPIKVAVEPDESVFVESHEPLTARNGSKQSFDWPLELQVWLDNYQQAYSRVNGVIQIQTGLPTIVHDGTY
ncbi:peptidase [Vibrio sp. UCD-FRSSP16_10]|uniref:L,D-transpeptidase family protein n=1 Tax=unclassified Vibrio TaxID=2614977 RepID=UPI0008016D3C|nr:MULTISPECIES: L,D-transpeptidase family protein [unclassified Vibrio]OBT09511.1 peptidase [Vibrio sp. UCD-FRSSP16_30]OBT19545.1 peptidase [Vibrio sp. UCD-FRSSP16_10]